MVALNFMTMILETFTTWADIKQQKEFENDEYISSKWKEHGKQI